MTNPNFRELRRLTGCTQVTLANKTGISRVRLSLAETGQLRLKPEEKDKVLRILRREMERSSNALLRVRQTLANQDPPAIASPVDSLRGQ